MGEAISGKLTEWIGMLYAEGGFGQGKIAGFMYSIPAADLMMCEPAGPVKGNMTWKYMEKPYSVTFEYQKGAFVHVYGKNGMHFEKNCIKENVNGGNDNGN